VPDPGNVVFLDGLPVALNDFDLAKPTTRLYDIANALWCWAPLSDPRDRAPASCSAAAVRPAGELVLVCRPDLSVFSGLAGL
jgi:aminoglycoside phosphotransferase (APT) family kinase protein